jgi:hypothetical protein
MTERLPTRSDQEHDATMTAIDSMRTIVFRFQQLNIWPVHRQLIDELADKLETAERNVGRRR